MLIRGALAMLLVFALFFFSVPTHSNRKVEDTERSTTSNAATTQDPGLAISTTKIASPDHTNFVWNLTGRYQNAGRALNLRATTTVKPSCQDCGINPGVPSGTNASSEAAESEYYYSESDMSRSDGTVVAQTVYQYDEQANRNTLSVTLNGVTFNFDIDAAQEITPVSDEDLDRFYSWRESDEGLLVRQAGVALVQQGYQEPDNDALLTYWLVAMMVDDASTTQAVYRLPERPAKSIRSHHASSDMRSKLDLLNVGCSSRVADSRQISLPKIAPAMIQQSNCYGCCGPGCYCLPDLFGRRLYATPCQQHDECTAQYGYRGTFGPCFIPFVASIQYVIFVRVSQRRR
jgi:hypothetical protein